MQHDQALLDPRALVEQGAYLVDVRTPEEFATGHLPGALNLPVQRLSAALGALDASKPVVLYCRSGRRSAMAALAFRNAGFAPVIDIGTMSNF